MDTSKYFLRVLAEPKSKPAEIDIVAVHGLNPFKTTSNAISTWTSASGKMWLQDDGFLPTQVPNARIMLFGYNSNVAFASSNAGLVQQATNLLVLLDLNRADCPRRPIIFLCHSLGGILVKRALVQARLVDIYAPIYEATYGIVFFATPHGGGNNAKVGSFAASIARKLAGRGDNNFMEALKKKSYYGEQNRDDFLNRAKDFSYLTFYEANPTRKFKIFTSKIVDRQNAILGMDDERELKFAMDDDHESICKFDDPLGEDYFPVWTNILKMSNQAIAKSKATYSSDVPSKSPEPVSPDVNMASEEKMLYILPHLSISCFVQRPALMKQLEQYSTRTPNSPSTVVVLLGMGGQGKSQLTMEFCRASRAAGKFKAIFWIDVTSNNSLMRSFEDIIAKISDSAPVSDSITSKVAFVKDIIESWSFPWLLVFDNYDRPDKVLRISGCFPQSNFGTIIVTSRHANSKYLGRVINVTGMSEDESLDLLFSRSELTRTNENVEGAKSVVAQLGYLPLAIDQAGTYISAQSLSMSLFSTHYQERKAHILRYTPSLTEYRKQLNDSDAETAVNVFTTMELSLQGILGGEKTREAMEDFLTQSAFYSNKSIGEDIAQIAALKCEPSWMHLFLSEDAWDHYKYQDTIANLNNLSLLQSMSPGDVVYFSLHPLVADWLKLRRQIPVRRACIVLSGFVLKVLIESVNVQSMQLGPRQYLLAHIDSYLYNQRLYFDNADFMDDYAPDHASCIGYFLRNSGRYNEAEELYQRALVGYTKTLGAEDLTTLAVVQNLGELYGMQDKLKESEEMCQRALQGYQKKLGMDNQRTLVSVCGLGEIYRNQGRLDETEEMYQRALKGCQKVLAEDNPSISMIFHSLGLLYGSQGKLKEAEEMYQQALQGYKKTPSENHLSMLNIFGDLGIFYQTQGKLNDAEEMYQKCLQGFENVLGTENPSTLRAVNNFGTLYHKQGKLKEAEEMYQKCLQGFEKVLGKDNSSTLWAVVNLGVLYQNQGKLKKAKEMYQRASKGLEKTLGSDNPLTIQAAKNLKSLDG